VSTFSTECGPSGSIRVVRTALRSTADGDSEVSTHRATAQAAWARRCDDGSAVRRRAGWAGRIHRFGAGRDRRPDWSGRRRAVTRRVRGAVSRRAPSRGSACAAQRDGAAARRDRLVASDGASRASRPGLRSVRDVPARCSRRRARRRRRPRRNAGRDADVGHGGVGVSVGEDGAGDWQRAVDEEPCEVAEGHAADVDDGDPAVREAPARYASEMRQQELLGHAFDEDDAAREEQGGLRHVEEAPDVRAFAVAHLYVSDRVRGRPRYASRPRDDHQAVEFGRGGELRAVGRDDDLALGAVSLGSCR
jgi:hypothetical protein